LLAALEVEACEAALEAEACEAVDAGAAAEGALMLHSSTISTCSAVSTTVSASIALVIT
jgi:hypothetical protein